ncbi:MAG: M48 family metalloprotease, partial [Sandaracinaceae bacterium]|nr:M48 family metalloprotease [Sandaracinaceae bacterium]
MTTEARELFPPRPEGVPADLTAPTAAYRRHTWLAFLGLLGFVGLYVGLTGYLGWIVYRLLYDAFTGGNAVLGVVLAILPTFFLVFLVRGLFVVKHLEDPTRVQVTEDEQPELFAFVNRIADEAGAPRPHKLYLSARVNAAVFYDLSFLNLLFPTRKNLELGLGLVQNLGLDELKAVIAHEFGHFAQRTMAVGRWVYVAQQIAGHIIVHRGWVDRLLQGLSYTDLRIAWIGWILRLIVWSIRAVLDTAFRLIVLAHRALTREMELQADLVAVSVSGSDSLIHALHRLGPADDAWDQAVRFSNTEIDKKRPPEDLFAVQERILEHLRRVLDDEGFGAVPPRPKLGGEAHRVFEEALAQPPRMWSTHPPNREREDNAKRRYVPSPLDPRPAWSLFRDAAVVRRSVSRRFYDAGGPEPIREAAVPIEETLARVDEDYRRPSLDRRYRGAYLNRTIVGFAPKVANLYTKVDDHDAAAILRGIDGLYPEPLKDDLER